jgi:peptidoglycan/LPS O-acetylase OafA/YrhL
MGGYVQRQRLSGLDGLRALAVLAVLLFHADSHLLPGGFLGVDLFFVISGYLITRMLLTELGETGKIDLARFYLRRVFRLLPAVLALIVVVSLGSALVWRDELATLPGGALSSLGYVANWWLIDAQQSYFVSSGRPPMLQHLWSLAIEEQFYLLWPVLLLLLLGGPRWLKPARFGRIAWLAFGLAAGSAMLMGLIAVRSGVPFAADSSRVYFGTDTHAMGLLLGATLGALAERLAFQPRRGWRVRTWTTDVLGGAALVGLGILAVRVNQFMPALYRGGFFGASALAVVVVATVARRGSLLGHGLDIAPLRWLGDRSYSLYLWHWPVIVVTRPGVDVTMNRWLVLAIRILLPMVLAELSYRYLERPVRRFGADYLSRRSARGRTAGRRAALVPRLLGGAMLLLVLTSFQVNPHTTRSSDSMVPVAATGPRVSDAPTGPAGPGAARARAGSAPVRPKSSPASPKPALPVPKHKAGLTAFGDSVLLGAASAVSGQIAQSQVRAVEGRQPYVTLADVRDEQAGHRLAPSVVIHTGNNGIIRPSDLASTLAALGDRQRVVVLTDRVPMDWQDPNNATIKRVAKGYRNVVVLDWFGLSNGSQGWFYPDGLHLREPGAARYAALLAEALR